MRALLRWLFAVVMSTGLFMLVFPGCGRSSLEPEDLDASATSSSGNSSSGSPACGPATCSNGCCDANGQCQTGRNTRACGAAGGSCKDCVSTGFDTCTDARVCARTVTNCGPSNCPGGCCAFDGSGNEQCLSGTEATACGRGGEVCTNCEDDGRACDLSTRSCGTTRCDASNCSGCCVGDLCLPGNSQFACGANGGSCGRCNAGEVCRVTSVGGGRCETTQTKCGPANCGGCCTVNGTCLGGQTDDACGRLGQQCDRCNQINEYCVPDGLPGARTCQPFQFCGPGNCDGCCLGDTCIPAEAQSNDFCGIKGQQCIGCGPNQTCNPAGFCENTDTCGPLSCGGCCLGDICATGAQNTACGVNGQQCQNCLNQFPARTCQSGSCQQMPQCNQFTCPNGCCQGNTCVSGTQDKACGGGFGGFDAGFPGFPGQQCQDCTLFGETCQNRTCQPKCGPFNCNGCCNAAGNCVGGISSNACGQFGGSCDNCTSRNTFCNGLVQPRACNDAQKECPAPYGSCPNGLTVAPEKVAQNVCTDFDLDDIAQSCSGDPNDFFCQLVIGEKSFQCQDCITRFTYPFAERTGLYACAAETVTDPKCLHNMACTSDCDEQSCQFCSSSSTETSCYSLVNNGQNQCAKFAGDANSCANDALKPGERCSQFSYPDFTSWLREVGDHFCGDNK